MTKLECRVWVLLGVQNRYKFLDFERINEDEFRRKDRLMNWGYAICDAALRAHLDPALQAKLGVKIDPPKQFPFAGGY